MAKKELDKLVGPLRTRIRVGVDKQMSDAEYREYKSRDTGGQYGGKNRIDGKSEK